MSADRCWTVIAKSSVFSDCRAVLRPNLINGENSMVKLLLKAPLTVALSITGKDESIWQNNEMSDDNEIIRRNIQYAQSIHTDWHTKAIIYSINSINRIGK